MTNTTSNETPEEIPYAFRFFEGNTNLSLVQGIDLTRSKLKALNRLLGFLPNDEEFNQARRELLKVATKELSRIYGCSKDEIGLLLTEYDENVTFHNDHVTVAGVFHNSANLMNPNPILRDYYPKNL